MTLIDLCWPLNRLAEGLEELARRCRLLDSHADAPLTRASSAHDVSQWIEWAGSRLGIEAELVETTVAEIATLLRKAGPLIVRIPASGEPVFLLVHSSKRSSATVLGADMKLHRCPIESVCTAMSRSYEAPITDEIDRVLDLAHLSEGQRKRARAALVLERTGAERIAGFWLLRLPPTAGFRRQLLHARLPQRLIGMLAAFAALYAMEILGWGLIGNAALSGRLDLGWMSAWILLVVTLMPLVLLGGWLSATFALDVGRLLKRRLLAGALLLDLNLVCHQGVGQMLSRVMESQALESMALNGGMMVLVALLELSISAGVLWLGAAGTLLVSLLALWLVVTVWLALQYVQRMRTWTLMRLDMTHELLERMVGHRTILAQEWPWRRELREDQCTNAYLDQSRRMDRAGVSVFAGVPGGWGLLGLVALAPAFVTGKASASELAIAFGGLLLSTRAFSAIAMGMAGLANALIAWQQVGPLFRAGRTEDAAPAPYLPSTAEDIREDTHRSGTLIDASRLVFRHDGQRHPVLDGASLVVRRGERLLLQGASGGGKSSLASLLVGLRQPESGLLLLNGLDRATLGYNWHRLATEAPQFHENHVLSGTLGFNLLMGRNWPASDEELDEARSLLIELGLGELLQRMPAGMLQMVGETGWKLSHGERSRIFLARALLQKAEFTVLDESFAALDPETLKLCLDCVFQRSTTLMVIAHP